MIITTLWRNQPGKHFCLSTKSSSGEWKDHFFSRNEFSKVTKFLRTNSDKDLYFCPHGFDRPRRLKPYAVLPRLLWADMDEADPRECKIRPTVAIESSPGRFVGLWVTDEATTESLNRRMTYFLGSDVSGWDLTQVLRVPGTTNYKYDSLPRTRILWSDGPQYTLKRIERILPEEEEDPDSDHDATEVYREYEKKLPHWCRRELMNGKPVEGKRSEMVWKLVNTLVECGVSVEDTFTLIQASPWNKFAGRHNEKQQLKREIDKAINRHFQSSKPAGEVEDSDKDYRWLSRSLADVEPENIDWVWYPYLARNELTILEGDPGLGKSYLAQMVSGHIIDGKGLPTVKEHNIVKGKVVYFDIENSAESVTIKRIIGNGFKELSGYIQEEAIFSIDDEERMAKVYGALERVRPVLIVFDTINTYLGKADAFKGHEAQQAFVKFRAMARRFNCAVLVLRHLTKSTKERALYRGQGSIAFAGIARIVITVGVVPDDQDTRAFAITKMNIAKKPQAHTFRILALPDTRDEKDRSKFEWGEFVDLTADDIIGAPEKGAGAERDDAKEFLKGALEEGAIELKRIERMAEARSISSRTLQRAADELGVVKKLRGFGKEKLSVWSLPAAD